MANATNYEKFATPYPAAYMDAEWGGKVRATHDTFTFASAAVGTTVNVGVLLPGEVFLTGWVIAVGGLASGATLELGDAGDSDRYLAAATFETAGQVTQCAKADGVGYKNSTTETIPLVLKTATAEVSGVVEVIILKAAAN